MEIPEGYEAQVRPRSGLALKQGLTVLNSPGTIDSDYRGPVGALLINLGADPVVISPRDRVAQMVIAAVEQPTLELVEDVSPTERGSNGFGSSGT
jgi:dUTP pyrophosphatase